VRLRCLRKEADKDWKGYKWSFPGITRPDKQQNTDKRK
jgi:hypothetical protein